MDHVVPAQNLITTSEQLDALVEDYADLEAFAFDVETTGDNRLNPRRAQMLWLCLATTGRCDVIPMGHPHGDLISERPAPVLTGRRKLDKGKTYEELRPSDLSRSVMERVWTPAPVQLSHTEVFTALRSVFMSDATKVGQNVKFDLHSVGQYLGELPAPPYFDTHIATWLLDVSKKGGRSLDDLTRQFLGYDMTKGVGENVVEYGFNTVAAYSYLDGRYTWLLYQHLIERFAALSPDTQKLLALEMEVLEPTMMMESSGVRIDVGILGSLDMLFRDNIEAAKAMCMYQAGRTFNLNSPKDKQELLFKPKSSGGQGLRIHKLTASGEKRVSAGEKPTIYDASTDAESLSFYPHNELVAQMQTYASFTKLLGTYVTPYLGGEKVSTTNGKSKVEEVPSQLDGGRIYGRFNQTGAESGRFSCVAGETLLPTSRGTFRFDEYLPQQGDRVLTHEGRWQPVVRKIYKGTCDMYRLVVSTGATVLCTLDHRLLTPTGWRFVRDLRVGDEVVPGVGVEELGVEPGQSTGGTGLLSGRRQAHAGRGGRSVEHDLPQRRSGALGTPATGAVQVREGAAVLTLEGRRGEPYDGQEWLAASQLQGIGARSEGIFDGARPRQAHVSAPQDVRGCSRAGEVASYVRRASHRRGPDEQRPRQLGLGDRGRARRAASRTEVVALTPVGPMGVWDVEVAGDHSYVAAGLIHHNSSGPNLQNIPSRSEEGKKLRSVFVPNAGHVLICADYSQIEPRIIASLAKDKTMLQVYRDGGDVYQAVADRLSGPTSGHQITRAVGKELVLSIAYGIGPESIGARTGLTMREAKELMEYFTSHFRSIPAHKSAVIAQARRRRYAETMFGRRRPLPGLFWNKPGERSKAERQAYNHTIQGSAADLMKFALVKVYDALLDWPEARLLLTVHDEVVITAPKAEAEQIAASVKEQMESIGKSRLAVPLVADVGMGLSWADAKH